MCENILPKRYGEGVYILFISSLSKTGTCKGIWMTTKVTAGNTIVFTRRKERPLALLIRVFTPVTVTRVAPESGLAMFKKRIKINIRQ